MNISILTIKRKKITDFAEERNKLLRQAQSEWVLFLDSDEIMSPELVKEINNLQSTLYNGFYIKRKGIVEEWLLRLAKKDSGKWYRKVHEVWQIKAEIGYLKNPIIHKENKSLFETIKKINFYSTLHAEANKLEGKRSSLFKIILFPKLKFLQTFFLKKAYKKGLEGFVFSLMQAFHSFLSWVKLYYIK